MPNRAPGAAGRVALSLLAWPPAPPCRADVKDRHPPLHSLPLTLCPLPLALQRACLSTVTPWPQQGRLAAPSSYRYHRPGYGQTLQLTAGAACARPNPPSVAALFPPSPEPAAWSRCCSWFGHFRLPPSKLRPPLVRTGPTPYCPSATRRHRRIPLRLLCFAPVRGCVQQLEERGGPKCITTDSYE